MIRSRDARDDGSGDERHDDDGTGLVLDCRRLQFMDSTGLAVLLGLRRRFGSDLRLVRGPQDLQRMFDVTGITNIVPFFDTPESRAAD